MRTFDQKELLQQLQSRVESHLEKSVRIFYNLPETKLHEPSSQGGWSIAENLDHLNGYLRYYNLHLELSLQKAGKSSGKFKSSWLGNYFANAMEPGSQMKKMKAFKDHLPAKNPDALKVVAEFIQHQEKLLQLLRMAADKDLRRPKVRITISRFIKLQPGDVFRFLIAHDHRHLVQAERNL